MAERYSQVWWNEQAKQQRLYRTTIEALTGLTFRNVFINPNDPTQGFSQSWWQDVLNRAPGFRDAHLPITGIAEPYPPLDNISAQLTWPENLYFASALGFIAPNASGGWAPDLSATFTPEPAPDAYPSVSGPIPPAPTSNTGTVSSINLSSAISSLEQTEAQKPTAVSLSGIAALKPAEKPTATLATATPTGVTPTSPSGGINLTTMAGGASNAGIWLILAMVGIGLILIAGRK